MHALPRWCVIAGPTRHGGDAVNGWGEDVIAHVGPGVAFFAGRAYPEYR